MDISNPYIIQACFFNKWIKKYHQWETKDLSNTKVVVNFVTHNQKFLNLTDTNTQVVTTRSGLHQLRKRLHTFANTHTQHDLQGSFLPPLKLVRIFCTKKSNTKVCSQKLSQMTCS